MVPDPSAMTNVLSLADTMTTYGVLRFADFSGADIASLSREAHTWLGGIILSRAMRICPGAVVKPAR